MKIDDFGPYLLSIGTDVQPANTLDFYTVPLIQSSGVQACGLLSVQLHISSFECLVCFLKTGKVFGCFMSCGNSATVYF